MDTGDLKEFMVPFEPLDDRCKFLLAVSAEHNKRSGRHCITAIDVFVQLIDLEHAGDIPYLIRSQCRDILPSLRQMSDGMLAVPGAAGLSSCLCRALGVAQSERERRRNRAVGVNHLAVGLLCDRASYLNTQLEGAGINTGALVRSIQCVTGAGLRADELVLAPHARRVTQWDFEPDIRATEQLQMLLSVVEILDDYEYQKTSWVQIAHAYDPQDAEELTARVVQLITRDIQLSLLPDSQHSG